jgi:uncharacterized protein with FMN-binding domain
MLGTAATVSGVVLLLALKQPADGSASAAAQAPAPSGPAAAASPSQNAQDALGGEGAQKDSGSSASSVPSSGSLASKTASAAPKPSATKSSGASGSSGSGSTGSGASSAAKTVTGNAVDAQYGAVQVKLTVKGGKVTAAEAVQGPTTGPGGSAIPTLNKEVVTAQSATIDSVSGASFTSEGYKKSLQSAIDKAGL